MKSFILAILATLFVTTGAFAATATSQNPSQRLYGNSHNNYRAAGTSYGASHNNYNGKATWGGAPHYTNHPADYLTSRQALDTSVPY